MDEPYRVFYVVICVAGVQCTYGVGLLYIKCITGLNNNASLVHADTHD